MKETRLSESTVKKAGRVVPSHGKIVVKFEEELIDYKDHAESSFSGEQLKYWHQLEMEHRGITLRRLFSRLDQTIISEYRKKTLERIPERDRMSYRILDHFSYFTIELPPDTDLTSFLQKLRHLPFVKLAYQSPTVAVPVVNNAFSNQWPPTQYDPPSQWQGSGHPYDKQGYLYGAPDGLSAFSVWQKTGSNNPAVEHPGADGEDQDFVDLELAWAVNHADLSALPFQGNPAQMDYNFCDHGTSVLGVVCANDNQYGCIGIVPNIGTVRLVSASNVHPADAILQAVVGCPEGGILLIELQTADQNGHFVPVEVEYNVFKVVKDATISGIAVVEAAGNSGVDLDGYHGNEMSVDPTVQGHDKYYIFKPAVRDSGAILVGAAHKELTKSNRHKRIYASNFGSRVNCYAWGEAVVTCTASNAPQVPGAAAPNAYTRNFGHTSAASAIVAGAALSVQGMAEKRQCNGKRLHPLQLRQVLSDNGLNTRSTRNLIGVMPDLLKIAAKITHPGFQIADAQVLQNLWTA